MGLAAYLELRLILNRLLPICFHYYRDMQCRNCIDEEFYNEGDQQYEYGVTTLVNNQARVFKGGSWNDRAYWLSPGTRRYLDQEQSTSTLGFRCAMHRVGAPSLVYC